MIALLLVGCASPGAVRSAKAIGPDVPRTDAHFRDDPTDFQFAIVADRTGGPREGVFPQALKQINMLQPAFVMSVGDLIEGYIYDHARLNAQWDEIDSMVKGLDMPFFYVAGNHDMGNEALLEVWRARHGREYYHFVYKDVLFLALSTEDPPVIVTKETEADIMKLGELMKSDRESDREKASQMVRASEALQKAILYPKISDLQVDYFRQVLADHPDVRWTFVLMHKPAWEYGSEDFREIESMLQGRDYTVFAGHHHSYKYLEVNGRDYIRLGTTGGGMDQEVPGSFDHFVVVTMTKEGPRIVNLRLDGVLDRSGSPISN
jgi:hypothetical protein